MKRFVILLLVACGSKQPKPAPIDNTEPGTTQTPAPGSGEARVVQRGKAGGVIELNGDRAVAMEAANKEMANVCGADKYVIVQEGEEAVGGDGSGMATVWRVHYQCN